MTGVASAEINRTRIVATARGWLRTPYHHQAAVKGAGCDCLGLLRGVFAELYGAEPEVPPPYTPSWAEDRACEALRDAARRHLAEIPTGEADAGDVILFRWRDGLPAKHCAILTARNRMIHAYDGHAVAESWIPDAWARRAAYAFRFPGVDQ
ncbi:peptidase P60 [Methylobacterium sp. Leaf102]|uniref:NlpC/P60 family protein n=1 Tax=Methylobacterium sp. Leaf102 TaxID=1736253 RepID=UPI0006F3E9D2|nr:NlpC/P60 family protein [Methylobacterium sp. Leaf102]KQP34308.1 peptidase P60 [Methylobacterium sp. Leaf102]